MAVTTFGKSAGNWPSCTRVAENSRYQRGNSGEAWNLQRSKRKDASVSLAIALLKKGGLQKIAWVDLPALSANSLRNTKIHTHVWHPP